MKNKIHKNLVVLSLLFFPNFLEGEVPVPPSPIINEITILTPNVEKYGKFEAKIDLTSSVTNRYDYDQITVSATFTSPAGIPIVIDGFYMQDYTLNETTGSITPLDSGAFRVRFSPNAIGSWSFVISVTDISGTDVAEPTTFLCTDILSTGNHGFLRTGESNYLQFDDETQYIAIGENIAWNNNNPYLDYKLWLNNLADNGGNFFRLWHAHWGLGIEWSIGNGFEGLRKYKQSNCFYQDWIFDFCAENGIYVMLALQHHGTVSTQVNPNWDENPYNAVNGGGCENTIDFFTDEDAINHTKNRYRYIIARWGYSRNILSWELFNEVHWTDNYLANKELVAEWHFEMANYLKTLDPNAHLVTTSFGSDLADEAVWSHFDFDFTQTHIYIDNANLEKALANGNRRFLNEFEKPTLNGEFSLGGSPSLLENDPDGIHIHNCLWGGLFSGGFGTAMTWWWDSYIHPQNLYYHFLEIAQLTEEIPFVEKRLSPVNAFATGAPGDLILTPTLNWAEIGEEEITVDVNGVITPFGAALSQFLYGSVWNTQYRSPPVFNVNSYEGGEFIVTTGPESGQNPIIAIWLDDVLIVEEPGLINDTYSIIVPAGEHTIMVDNLGTDWIKIESYTFEGMGSQVGAYALVSEDQQFVAGWALNNSYNHQFIEANGEPDPVLSSTVIIEGFQNGEYPVFWYDPITGTLIGEDVAIAGNGTLTIPLPYFLWDVVYLVDNSSVGIVETPEQLIFEVYPNPVNPGAKVSFNLPSEDEDFKHVTLLNAEGRELWKTSVSSNELQLPIELTAGYYWMKIERNGKIGARPLVIVKE